MAKKKEIIVNPKNAPADVPTGDVVVAYGTTAIAALSEAGSIACQTADTICEANISIEYQPPAPATVTIPIYTKIDNGEPEYVGDFSAIPGTFTEIVVEMITASSLSASVWSNPDFLFNTDNVTNGYYTDYDGEILTIAGNQVNKIPTGFDRILIYFA